MLLQETAHVRDMLPAHSALPSASIDFRSLFVPQQVEKLATGVAAFWEGDPADHVYEVVEGVLRTFRVLLDGRRVIIGFVYPGQFLGLALRGQHVHSAEAVTPVRLRRCKLSRFQDAVNQSAELRKRLMALLYEDMTMAQDQMVLLARKTAEERVCSFLMSIARRTRQHHQPIPALDLPMTRLDMADYLGLTIETVSRTMTKLASRQVIRLAGRHTVQIRNWRMLAKLAGDDDDVGAMNVPGSAQALCHH